MAASRITSRAQFVGYYQILEGVDAYCWKVFDGGVDAVDSRQVVGGVGDGVEGFYDLFFEQGFLSSNCEQVPWCLAFHSARSADSFRCSSAGGFSPSSSRSRAAIPDLFFQAEVLPWAQMPDDVADQHTTGLPRAT